MSPLARLVTPVVYKLLAPPLDQDLVTDLGGTAVAVDASSVAVSGERFDGGAL